MKVLSKISFAIIIAFILSSCSTTNNKGELQYLSFKISKSDKWGIIDGNGKVVVEDEFSNQPLIINNGIFFVPNDEGEIQMFSISEPTKDIECKFKQIAAFGDGEDLTPSVKKGECIKYVDKKGAVKYTLAPDYVSAMSFYKGWSFIFKETDSSNLSCVMNRKGEIFAPSKFTIINILDDDRFLAKKDDNYFIINSKEEELNKLKANVSSVSNDLKYFIYVDDNLYGLKNIDGEILIRAKYKSLDFTNIDNRLIFKSDDDLYGIMDFKGDIIVKAKYYSINNSNRDNMYVVQRESSEGKGLINEEEDKLLKFDYSTLGFLPGTDNLLAKKQDDKSYYIINTNGEPISKDAEFYDLEVASYVYWENTIINSDVFDVTNFVKSILNPSDSTKLSYTDLFGNIDKSVEKVCKNGNYNISYYDILNDYGHSKEFLPFRYVSNFKYGTLKYSYGFDKIAESYYDYDEYETKYGYAQDNCNCLKLKVSSLTSKVKKHIDLIKEDFGKGLESLGFVKEEQDTDNGTYSNNKLRVEYKIDGDDEITVYIVKK